MKSEIKITENQLQITRVFNAPRPRVFAWWAQADKLEQWSGCKDATSCKVEMDFREGALFTQTMQIAGCGEFSFTATYEEIVQPERIVYRADLGYAKTKVAIEFHEHLNQTRVVLTQERFANESLCKTVLQGTEESFEKLDSLIERSAFAEIGGEPR